MLSNLMRTCPACGQAVSAQRFCHNCGLLLNTLEPSPPEPLAADGSIERRMITVMFCDIVGSSAIAASLDPEEFAQLLLAYRDRCSTTVARYRGYISRYAGDGVIACFGYPHAIGRDAQAAVACGLQICREITALAKSVSLPRGAPLAVRVGIETGVVVAGRLGPGNTAEFDALVGTAPNDAARLQELAPPNGVVIGQTTFELAGAELHSERLPVSRLGRLQPGSRAFLVHGRAAQAGEGRFPATRPAAGLVARQKELELLERLWSLSTARQGQVALLSGEAGIGKSRISAELAARIRAAADCEMTVLVCSPQSAGTAMYPVTEAFRTAIMSDHAGLAPAAAFEAMAGAIGLPRGAAREVLAEAIGIGPGPLHLEPKVRQKFLLQGLEAWLIAKARRAPHLIVVEDVHWADPSTMKFLETMLVVVTKIRAMLLVTYRDDFVLPWSDRAGLTRLLLRQLSRAESEQLLDSIGGERSLATREAILSRSDGVPLFVEEFALAADTEAMPATLRQLFTARLDSLGGAKRLAQCAAVMAPHLSPDLLGYVSGVPVEAVGVLLDALVHAEVLVQAAEPPCQSFRFRHALLQQAAEDALLGADRKVLSGRAAVALARLRPETLERRPEVIADYHAAAGEAGAAWPLYAAAARRAIGTSAMVEAEAFIRRGIEQVGTLSSPGAVATAELELYVLLGHVLIARLGYASAAVQEAFEAALKGAERTREQVLSLAPLRGLASFFQVRGPLAKAARICNRLVAASERLNDPLALTDALRRRGWNRACTGRLTQADEDLTRSLATFDPKRLDDHIATSGQDPQVLALANLCWLDGLRRGTAAAAARALQTVKCAAASPHAISACYGFIMSALMLQQAGQWEMARDLAERALVLAEDKGIVYWIALARIAVGYDVAVRIGDPEAGLPAIRQGLISYRETQGEVLRPFILRLIADGEVASGNEDAARVALNEAIAASRMLGATGFLPELWLREARLQAPTSERARRGMLRRAAAEARRQGADALTQCIEAEQMADGLL